jgi:hypothetical protein
LWIKRKNAARPAPHYNELGRSPTVPPPGLAEGRVIMPEWVVPALALAGLVVLWVLVLPRLRGGA